MRSHGLIDGLGRCPAHGTTSPRRSAADIVRFVNVAGADLKTEDIGWWQRALYVCWLRFEGGEGGAQPGMGHEGIGGEAAVVIDNSMASGLVMGGCKRDNTTTVGNHRRQHQHL